MSNYHVMEMNGSLLGNLCSDSEERLEKTRVPIKVPGTYAVVS